MSGATTIMREAQDRVPCLIETKPGVELFSSIYLNLFRMFSHVLTAHVLARFRMFGVGVVIGVVIDVMIVVLAVGCNMTSGRICRN